MTPRLAVALTLAVLAVAIPAVVANAAFPGDNGRILFTSQPDNSEGLYTTAPDRIDRQPLITTEGDEEDGAFSPDGRSIAFVSRRTSGGNDYEVYVRESGVERQVTFNTQDDQDPTWSPDGKQIAYSSTSPQTFLSQILVTNADGSGTPTPLTETGDNRDPAWSPDGRTILFESRAVSANTGEVYAMDANGANERPLTDPRPVGSSDPEWSPDGSVIAFTSGTSTATQQDIWTMTATGASEAPLPGATSLDESEPAFSPDGTRIAFTRWDNGGQIWAMDRDGTDQTRLTPVDANSAVDADWQPIARPPATTTPTQTATATPTPTVTPTPTPTPVAGEQVVTKVRRGVVRYRVPPSKTWLTLPEGAAVPVGSEFDTLKGQVRIEIPNGPGKTTFAWFWDGLFKVTQPKGSRPLTTLTLTQKLTCPKARTATTSAARRRRLWGDGKGRFRTKGRFSSATVRGTKWLVEDTCTFTRTRVNQGAVTVRHTKGKKTKIVRKGKTYTVRKR